MNPHELAEKRVALSATYSTSSERLGILKAARSVKWLIARRESKTDKEADMLIDASPEGQEYTKLIYLCKGLEREISAISSYLRVLDGESRGQY